MDDAKVQHACRLLHEALCDDLEVRRLVVTVERKSVLLMIHSKLGGQESRMIVGGEDSEDNNIHPLDERR
jgi:hypothetical protein